MSEKQVYTIGEVAKMFNVNTSLIRFWEKEFTIIKPQRNNKGNRLFTPDDITHFNTIYNLTKVHGYTLSAVKARLKNIKDDQTKDDTNMQLVNTLQTIKSFLTEIKNNL
jgi:DNA-binding transcriptional MerR regulator